MAFHLHLRGRSLRGILSGLALLWFAPTVGLAGELLYVSNERSDNVSVVDADSGKVLRTIAVGKRPRGIHVGPKSGLIYVALSGSPRMGPGADPERAKGLVADKSADGIGLVDGARQTVQRILRVGSDPEQFALTPDEKELIVSNEDVAQASAWNVETGGAIARWDIGEEPEGVTVNPAGTEVYVTCESRGELHVFDLATHRHLAQISIGGRPRSVAFTPDGRRAFVPSEGEATVAVIDTASRQVTGKISIDGERVLPMCAVVSPDGRTLFVSTGRGNTVAMIDTTTNKVSALIPVGKRPWGLALSLDGRRLYSANGASDDVSVIDVAQHKELSRIPVGAGPWGIAVDAR